MTRRTCRVSHDEVKRMVKAVQGCGLSVARVSFDGDKVDVIIGEIGSNPDAGLDEPLAPEDCSNLDQYRAWRKRERARGA